SCRSPCSVSISSVTVCAMRLTPATASGDMNMTALLDVNDLTVRFGNPRGDVTAIEGLSFAINPGECVGIVGESGSGKSQTFLNLLGLKAANASVSGSARFLGQEIINAPPKVMRKLRGNQISMIFQDSIT